MDEIALRFIGWFFIDVIMHLVCFGIGFVILKVFTLGKYPTKETNEDTVMYIGLGVLILLIISLTVYAYIYF